MHIADLPAGTPVEIWFQDEARLGQKNGLTRLWARKGTRPRQPADQRYRNAYLFGAICPAHGKGAALMLPWADAQAMQMHLDEISRHVARKGPCGCADGSGRMAHHRQTQSPEEPHHHPAAIARSGTEPGGKYLAVLARQLALQPRVRRLQCHRRCWMRSLKQARRTARNHHINRNAKMGPYRSMLNAVGIRHEFFAISTRSIGNRTEPKEPDPFRGPPANLSPAGPATRSAAGAGRME